MRAGKLDRSIDIQRKVESKSSTGSVTSAWTNLATGLRAEKIDATADETPRSFGEAERITMTFRIRYVGNVTTADRVIYEGVPFDLVGITEIGRRRGLELRCERSR
ncbi:MAG: head-tail adaptor protein [Mesorhizobium sp.]|uniref:phage head closure protein n=1 Tax=Mesorhizobium sp. TaxID=1871066 RepID=UPI000FE6362A|nr:phage head closure protein [Mesorhizobium sp.]RWI22043.1 MAG: head-tail adaptor protein [Mesorhizobium sp.]RWK92329.1 MAG: head-tail adaptor protein [Mesorhizobium sp.]